MIIRPRPGLLMLFFVVKGSIILRTWPQLTAVGLLSAAVVAAHRYAPDLVPGVNPAPFTLIGIALSIFLSFRNSACYDRWWEARKLWGQIIQTARDIARQTVVLDDAAEAPSQERRDILSAVIAFGYAAVRQLRRQTDSLAAGDPPQPANPADMILHGAAALVGRMLRRNRLAPVEALALNDSLGRLTQALVGCERLANTPLPFAYTLLLHRTAYLFCFILPFGFADTLGWATPLAAMLVAYTFFGLDALGEELEEPFGLMPNDLPISAYATTIEIHLRSALGETDLPPMPAPVDYVLI
ncbi:MULTISPECIES: bestrophin family protein [unclassified Rhizobium]|uniref:bestrophin family protein n=1 Tax=unclassified Rhizobium TaxID=2613769 RepID=UPI0006FC6169|nr:MULTISPECIES: bestrophin family protein [unclassified Rhizobium]KQV33688.1 bestrophin [Rhizobium sp. Root1212]KRD23232.1 bestrophin [Rhizobium sp. Root268]